MKHQALARSFALFACTFGLTGMIKGWERFSFHPQAADASVEQEKGQELKLSEGEREAAKKILAATTQEARLQAVADFIKKYPKSALRPQLASKVVEQIRGVQDPAQRVSASQTYLTIFTEPAEADAIQPILIAAYLDNKQLDDGFRVAAPWIEKHPEEIDLLVNLTIAGSNEAARGNPKFLQQSQQYGMKAIELLEADKKPAGIEDARWTEYKTRWLPALYREMGVVALRMGDKAAAKSRLEKSAALKTTDPSVYAILGNFADEEYAALVAKYKSAAGGAGADAALKQAQEQMDKVIELFAQAVALSEAKPEYKQISDQLIPSLQNYYKFRHNGSTDGLQQLIDKYKKAP
jgi:hypothetical protein